MVISARKYLLTTLITLEKLRKYIGSSFEVRVYKRSCDCGVSR